MVVGDSQTGKIIHSSVLSPVRISVGAANLRILSRFAILDIVPADAVAHAIAWSARLRLPSGRFYIYAPGPNLAVSLVDLRERVRCAFAAAGMRTPHTVTVSKPLFYAAARAIAMVARF